MGHSSSVIKSTGVGHRYSGTGSNVRNRVRAAGARFLGSLGQSCRHETFNFSGDFGDGDGLAVAK